MYTRRQPEARGPPTTNSLMQKVFSPSQLVALRAEFNAHDADGSGEIEVAELAAVVTSLGGQLTDEQVSVLFQEVDADGSGTISWDEYLSLMISLRTGRGMRTGAVAGLLARPPLVLLVEAEKGTQKYVTKLLENVRMPPEIVSQGRVEVVAHRTSESAMQWLLSLPPSRRIAMVLIDSHGIRANHFCAQLRTEMLSTPPVVYFAAEKRGSTTLPHEVKKYILKEQMDENVARDLIEMFCCIEDVHDPNDVPRHSSGHRRKDGMIGGRGGTGHRARKGGHTVRPPSVFGKGRWKGAMGELSARARQQLSEIGGGESIRVYHVKKDYVDPEEIKAQQQRDEEERRLLEEEGERRLAAVPSVPALPLWKTRLRETSVRSASGLHFFEKESTVAWAGDIRKAPPPTGHRFSLKARTRDFFPATARSPRRPDGASMLRMEHQLTHHSARRCHHQHRKLHVSGGGLICRDASEQISPNSDKEYRELRRLTES